MIRATASLLSSLALLAPLASPQDSCPISGIATTSLGGGTGVYEPSTLSLAWNAVSCSLDVEIQSFTCCNVYLTQHFLGIAPDFLPTPMPLRGKFLPGSSLYINPMQFLGPFVGLTSSIAVPPDPALVGNFF